MDKNTDSRHEPPASLEQVKPAKSSAEEHSVSKEDKDDISTISPEKKEEFAVPIIPSLHRRKNKKPNKVDKKETVIIEKTETLKPPEDNESQPGKKRTGSDGETDIHQEQNKETEENVS